MRNAIILFIASVSVGYSQVTFVPPFTLNWTDRRPIGVHIISSSASRSSINPRGWSDLTLTNYLSGPVGIANWGTNLLAIADTEVEILRNINAQGVIIWDVEGGETSITYLGDPRNLSGLAPEMDAVADQFFAKFTSAGFKVGVTVRSSEFQSGTGAPSNPSTNGQMYIQTDGAYQAKEWRGIGTTWVQTNSNNHQETIAAFYPNMLAKMEYAHTRWGCTLFYIDSYGANTDYGVASLTNVIAAHPDFLLVPEGGFMNTRTTSQLTNYFAMSVPYMDPNYSGDDLPTVVMAVYPNAVGAVRIHDQWSTTTNIDNIMLSIQAGNIMLGATSYKSSPDWTTISNAYYYISTNATKVTGLNVGTAIFR